jgi:hypothetical protein
MVSGCAEEVLAYVPATVTSRGGASRAGFVTVGTVVITIIAIIVVIFIFIFKCAHTRFKLVD